MPISVSSSAAIEDLARRLRLEREELGQPHRDAVEDALQRADRRVHLVRFDQRDRRISDAGALGELALRQPVAGPNESQPSTDIDAHADPCCRCCGSRKYAYRTSVKSMACRSPEKDLLRCGSRASAGCRQQRSVARDPSSNSEHYQDRTRSGCRSRRTGSSRRRRACSSSAEGMHYTHRSTAARCSTAPPASGASMPATAGKQIAEAVERAADDAGLRAGLPDGPPDGVRLRRRASPTIAPKGLDRVFFTNSGSESVEPR